jgi:hypothetical protein
MLATIFWNEEGILLIEFMVKGTTLTGASYATTIENLRKAIMEKMRGKWSREI